MGPLEEGVVAGGVVEDVNDDEDGDVEGDEEGGHGEELEVGEEAVLYHVEVVLVVLLSVSLVVEVWDLDFLHLFLDIL